MKSFFIYLILFISTTLTLAQDPGDNIFDNSTLHEVRFEFGNANYWEIMTSNYENTPEGQPVPYLMGKVTIDGEVVDSVGVRFKGFTSYTEANKKPIKIDFNEFVSGKKYDGLKKLNLNNGTGDASMLRDVICYDLLRHSGVKAPRTSFSKVYFNGNYWGLYQNIEQVDKVFLKTNFANGKGNLFKNKGWSHLKWEGSDDASYHPPFELKTNEDNPDWSGFVNFIDVLNNSSDADFPTAIEEVFNVNLFLKTLAVDVATNNWDSYMEHGRNWYMYEDTTSGIFNWIPWDYNFSLDGGNFGGAGGNCTLFPYFIGYTDGTTTVDFFDVSFYFGNGEHLWDFGDGNTSTEKNPIHTYAQYGTYNVCLTVTLADNCYDQICMSVNTIENQECPSVTNGTFTHTVDVAFFQVVDIEPDCCETWGQECEYIYNQIVDGEVGGSGEFFKINQQENEGVLIKRLLNVPEFNNRYYSYFCDLMNYRMTEDYLFDLIDHNRELITDAVQEDPNYLFSFENFTTDISANSETEGIKATLSTRIDSLQFELMTLLTCPTLVSAVPWYDVVVNEFVASTDSTGTITDEAGEVEDWIELYNNTSSDIDLTGVYLSDKIQDLQKWQFPSGTIIPADGYIIVWADKDDTQNGLHSNFKLNKSGEQLVLSNTDGTLIDSLTFGEQTENIPAARRPNGTGDFVFQTATFSANNNDGTSATFDLKNILRLSFYPVPASDFLEIKIQNEDSSDYEVSVFSATGQLVFRDTKASSSFRLDLNNWNDGFYFLQIKDKKGQMSRGKFVIAK